MSFDGAHWSPMPCVPGPSTTVGRGPGPVHGCDGTSTVPTVATGPPVAFVLRYIARVTAASRTAGVFGTTAATDGAVRRTSPSGAVSKAGGGV